MSTRLAGGAVDNPGLAKLLYHGAADILNAVI
jgi:hypothetical protein